MNSIPMDVFLDLDAPDLSAFSDEDAANSLLGKFQNILKGIGSRSKRLKRIGISYDTPSIAIYNQAKDLYSLGYYFSAVIVCRSAAEYLAFELFIEEVDLEGKNEVINTLAENLDFRKIVNEFLYNPNKGFQIIDKKTSKLFNDLYSLGNHWIHPKKVVRGLKIESQAFEAIDKLGLLLSTLRNVLQDYDVSRGVLKKKATAKNRKRPIVLGTPD